MKNEYVEMNIDEMKNIKETWQIILKNFTSKLSSLNYIETNNNFELIPLEVYYSHCIVSIKHIVHIYSDLINKGEMDELDEDYFLKKIKEIQRIHKNIQIESSNKTYKKLEQTYFSENVFNYNF